MTAPYLVASLVALRSAFNAVGDPNRDKRSDGWIGDAAHAARTSDHNPDAQGRVKAIDVDSTGPWPVPFGELVEACRGDSRLEYVIYNRRICSRSSGWKWETYSESDPHIEHAHFSARHDGTGNTSTAGWPKLEEAADMTPDQMIKALADELAKPNKDSAFAARMRAIGWQYTGGGIPEGMSTLGVLNELVGTVRRLEQKVDELAAPILPPPAQ